MISYNNISAYTKVYLGSTEMSKVYVSTYQVFPNSAPPTPVSVTGVTLNKVSTSIICGRTETLAATVLPSNATDKSVTWSTSDSSIATVTSNGVVSAITTGNCTITVTTTDGGYTAQCAVSITEPVPVSVTAVTLNKVTTSIICGRTETLVATVLPSNADDKSVTWTTSDSSIATVTSNGVVSAVTTGNCVITVTTTDGGYTAQCAVSVAEPSPVGDYVITYLGTSKLSEVTSDSAKGLHINSFNANILSHTFDNGVGTIVFDDDVTLIGAYAFSGCEPMTNITIPSKVTSIGDSAFQGCYYLTSIEIPDSVTSIGRSAFMSCTRLTSCTIGSGVTSIGETAFEYCSGLTSINIPDSVTSIGGHAFNGCSSLTSATIGNGVTSIGNYAFSGCTSLTGVTIGSGNIGYHSFNGCTNMTTCTMGNGVTSIGDSAFIYCTNLTSIDIPSGVTSIGGNAFVGCDSLTSVTIANSGITVGSTAFANNKIKRFNSNSNGVWNINFDVNGVNVFSDSQQLVVLNIEDNVTKIENGEFSGSTNLTACTIGSGVTSIVDKAFCGCSNLTSIVIPDNVTEIGMIAFYNCTGLTSITVNAVTPPSLIRGNDAFANTNNAPIFVPSNSVNTYKNTYGWSNYADRIQAIP